MAMLKIMVVLAVRRMADNSKPGPQRQWTMVHKIVPLAQSTITGSSSWFLFQTIRIPMPTVWNGMHGSRCVIATPLGRLFAKDARSVDRALKFSKTTAASLAQLGAPVVQIDGFTEQVHNEKHRCGKR
jgi:hypothetical protein